MEFDKKDTAIIFKQDGNIKIILPKSNEDDLVSDEALLVAAVAFFMNIATWVDDTKKWNKGICKLCDSPWLAAEGNVYDETEYYCKCGRTFWC
jgi:hypothetical protein